MESISLFVGGDVYLGCPDEGRPGHNWFEGVQEDIRNADLAIVNLEAPVATGLSPISKTGPALKMSAFPLSMLRQAGFSLLTLANNHIMDFGEEGLLETLRLAEINGLQVVGAGRNIDEARRPFSTEIRGVRLAIVNIAENEFSTTKGPYAGANPMDPVSNFQDIVLAQKSHDYVVVIVHGGHEGYNLPSPRMQELYRFYIDAGADCVISHHTHCLSGYEVYKERPIFYSLGNFAFVWEDGDRSADWYRGLAVSLEFNSGGCDFSLVPVRFDHRSTEVHRMTGTESKEVMAEIEELNAVISNPNALRVNFDGYVESVRKMYQGFLEPHSSRLLYALQNRGFLPSFLNRRKRTLLLNIIRCEAHRDVLLRLLAQ